ncbi:uncharacterized protein LOC125071039 isoform X1 [Vanessa atalanta]|uniref:uncharacterized protein LOC125071039 isoform X1 n=1 Tax=Vanessa atalanta TaxID=42275 RepID=UPI001FCD61CC|nr:uncharacterized protein LOC125071039 isoform X1 [Vanessa atalanta]
MTRCFGFWPPSAHHWYCGLITRQQILQLTGRCASGSDRQSAYHTGTADHLSSVCRLSSLYDVELRVLAASLRTTLVLRIDYLRSAGSLACMTWSFGFWPPSAHHWYCGLITRQQILQLTGRCASGSDRQSAYHTGTADRLSSVSRLSSLYDVVLQVLAASVRTTLVLRIIYLRSAGSLACMTWCSGFRPLVCAPLVLRTDHPSADSPTNRTLCFGF